MLLFYMAAGVGYGVHTCRGEGITSVSILVKESGCEGHSHTMAKQLSNLQINLIPLPAGILASADLTSNNYLAQRSLSFAEGEPPGHFTKEYLSYISVWRL